MVWDFDKQFNATMAGAHIEYGEVTIGSAGAVEIDTRFSVIKAAYFTHKSASAATKHLFATQLRCDLTISSGKVTLKDSGGAMNASAIVSYTLIGWP